jgi:hypothetical protein
VTAASGAYHAVYLGDEWEASSRLALTFGIRADRSTLSAHPPYVAASIRYSASAPTVPSGAVDVVAAGRLQLSPNELRHSAGSGARRSRAVYRAAAVVLAVRRFCSYGLATRTLQCGPLPSDAGAAPAFRPDVRESAAEPVRAVRRTAPRRTERSISSTRSAPSSDDARHARHGRAAPVRPGRNLEGLYTRATRAIFFSPINLSEPLATDRHGRMMYGTINATGALSRHAWSSR